MAYNPVTHEILVSGYSSPDASNYGCIFRLDPDTLEQKERIQLSTSYNILGIDYLPSTGGYLIQTDADGGYGFKLLDASLQVMDDWGTYPFDFLHGKLSGSLCFRRSLFSFSADDASRNRKLYPDILALAENTACGRHG